MFNGKSSRFTRTPNGSIGADFSCLIVKVAHCNGVNQWRTPRLVKVFNTVSPEMKAKRAKRASSLIMG